MTLDISIAPSTHPRSEAEVAEILANPGFGNHFTDHMFTAEWTPEQGWHDARITAYGPLTLDPATAVLHYAQETFEGMKAYRHDDGSDLDLPARGERPADGALVAPAGASRCWSPRTSCRPSTPWSRSTSAGCRRRAGRRASTSARS